MKLRSSVVVLIASMGLYACGGGAAANEEAKGPDPWAGYKGTYAGEPVAASHKSAPAKQAKAAEAAPAEETPAPKKSASRATIKGESVSSIGPDALADASKGALKSKVVSSNVTVGSQYEQVEVQLKGAKVQIIRPASSPDAKGPSISGPKARLGELGAADSSYYDDDADVLVVINAGKKPAGQKALGTILKK